MRASELRIGNWVNTEFGIRRISGIYNDGIIQLEDGNESVINEIQPIPLTEEWLLKFGFEWRGLGGKYLTLFTPCGKALVYIDGYVKFTNTTIETPIQYVHTLQNLYFALTGEELTIKNEER